MEKKLTKNLEEAKELAIIPAMKTFATELEKNDQKMKRRVVGYARVSTDEDDQLASYAAQVDYYKKFIKKNDSWLYVDLYSDEGITGCNTKHREGFNKMIKDALDGKFDLIVTKSISRFARNTVDSLSTIRTLKECNVEVFFERENIWTMDVKGELLITILSSLAQEEARSISENSIWGQRKRFADGKYSVGFSRFLGYDKGFKINEKEAEIVRLIFTLFIEGKKYSEIKKILESRGIPSVTGNKLWHKDVIKNILKNEKYCGDALLQKFYTTDFLTKTQKINMGEVKQYYIANGHEGIISKELYKKVQIEIARRSMNKERIKDIFSGKIICRECGEKYYRARLRTKDKNNKVVKEYIFYKCNRYGKGCSSSYIKIETVKEKFVKEFKSLLRKKLVLHNVIKSSLKILNFKELQVELDDCNKKISLFSNEVENEIRTRILNKLEIELNKIKLKIEKAEKLEECLKNLEQNYLDYKIKKFEEALFLSTVYRVYVDKYKNIEIVFNGVKDEVIINKQFNKENKNEN